MKNSSKNSLVTKRYLDQRLRGLEGRFDKRFKTVDELKNEFLKFKDYVYDKLDWLVGAFKKFDEEHAVLTKQYSEVNEKFDNHETRISGLEKKVYKSPSSGQF